MGEIAACDREAAAERGEVVAAVDREEQRQQRKLMRDENFGVFCDLAI